MERDQQIDFIRRTLDRPIVLIGLMGAGKSKLGRKLAGALEIPLTDTDDVIQTESGMSVTDYFDRFGESAFRDIEARVVRSSIDKGIGIIATGGGAIMRDETAEAVFQNTLSIWVRADLATMLERTAKNNDRPLLNRGNPEDTLKTLIAVRYPVYERADLIVDSTNAPSFEMLTRALDGLAALLHKRHAA